MMTFDELFAEHSLSPDERKKLVMHLATMRAQKTIEALQHAPSERSGVDTARPDGDKA